jgi:hypothetical protein
MPAAVREYATTLHDRLVTAWLAAASATLAEQAETISRDTRRSHAVTFKPGDRVARLLPPTVGEANKLRYLWSGPYRVSEVVSEGRYRLQDLENNIINDEFDVSNLRPYRTVVDAEELQGDEYLIDRILKHRDRRGGREYLIKWRQYPISEATWEPRAEVERRAAVLVEEYDAHLALHPGTRLGPVARRRGRPPAPPAPLAPPAPPAPPTQGPKSPKTTIAVPIDPVTPPQPAQPTAPPAQSDDHPHTAKFERGQWHYARRVATTRGISIRWFAALAFTQAELDSERFVALRDASRAASVHSVVIADYEQYICSARYHSHLNAAAAVFVPASSSPL